VGKDVIGALLWDERKMNLLTVRRELVVRADEAEQIEEDTRVADVEAQSQIRHCHRNMPALLLCGRLTTRRRCSRLWDCLCGKLFTRLTRQNSLGHRLCEIADRRCGFVLVLHKAQRSPNAGRRRRADGYRRRDLCDRRRHKSARALSPRTTVQQALSSSRINHNRITIILILKEEMARQGQRGHEGRESERHLDVGRLGEKVLTMKRESKFNFTCVSSL
jgi:hypothetical protein